MSTPNWAATTLCTLAMAVLAAVRMQGNPVVFANCCYFTAAGIVLSAIDIAVIHLSDALTLPSNPAFLVTLRTGAVGNRRSAASRRLWPCRGH
jgi:prepilin signal peptidase PulO-like enzyme (type II secretory pathway)